ncbi:ankyrin repeat domain-containing protein [uncultured Salinisphaera sp.]|uniref:ankyrin repeat domain-containing protein n=1 Tax=uncultured Salinisphaera sp. TaxID=359372 RepID=UPI0032B13E18
MKTILAIVVLAVAGILTALALDPYRDAACMVERAIDTVREQHAGWHCLHYAAARDDAGALVTALDEGLSVNLRTPAGQTPLNIAAEYGSLKVVRALLQRDAQLEARDGRNGFTALHWAAEAYHPAIARALIAAGAQPNAANKWEQTPLWVAAWQPQQGNTEIAHILVAAGADPTRPDHKHNTPLIMAARSGHQPMIGYLLDLGADIEARNDQGRTALFQAVIGAHENAVRLLLARGANPEAGAGGVVPLAYALNHDRRDIAALLVGNGASGYKRYAADAAMKHGRQALADANFDRAIDQFSAAIALQADRAEAYYRRGEAFAAKGERSQAEQDYRQATALKPAHAAAQEALARLYVDDGNYERAIGALQPLLENQPDNPRALFLMAESRDGLGDVTKANGYFERACTLGFQPACGR